MSQKWNGNSVMQKNHHEEEDDLVWNGDQFFKIRFIPHMHGW